MSTATLNLSATSAAGITHCAHPIRGSRPARQMMPNRALRLAPIRAEKYEVPGNQGAPKDLPGEDSFQKIEAPVRGEATDGGGSMKDRLTKEDKQIIADGVDETRLLGTEISLADAMRFKGAAPEIINCRLAMLGFVAALGAELATGKTIFEQTAAAPGPIAFTFALFAIATLIPIVRGQPRLGSKEMGGPLPQFTSYAEVVNGRLAIVGFPCLLIQEYIMKQPTFPHIF